jgi:phosphatidylglycerol:prolipoprotein diacylglycerol transferase
MRPTLVRLLGLEFHAYTTMLAVSFLVCTLLAVREGLRQHPPIEGNPRGGLWAFFGALIGAKVFWIIQYDTPWHVWRAVFVWMGGYVFYGGLLGGLLALLVYLRLNRLPILRSGDICVQYLALGEAITRVGCFLNGCCWGEPTPAPWGVCFPRNSYAWLEHVKGHLIDASASASLPVHPTQLYMVGGLVVAFLVMRRQFRRSHLAGSIILLYCFLYGILRFTVEHFRGDSARSVFGLTVSQSISVGLVLVALFGYVALRHYGGHTPQPGQNGPEPHEEAFRDGDAT